MLDFLIGTGLGVVFFAGVFLLWLTGQKSRHARKLTGKVTKWFWIRPTLAFVTGCALTGFFLGDWTRGLTSLLFDWLGDPVKVAGLGLVIAVILSICDLADGEENKVVLVSMLMIPTLALMATGPVASQVNHLRTGTNGVSTSVVGKVTGG